MATARDYNPQLESAVQEMRNGSSLANAAKRSGVSPGDLKAYIFNQGLGKSTPIGLRIGPDNRTRTIPIFSAGKELEIKVQGYEESRRVGQYMSAVGRFLDTNNPSHLRPFKGKGVRDTSGQVHPFETDPNTLYDIAPDEGDDFSDIYKIGN
jgi:hypothetical protein